MAATGTTLGQQPQPQTPGAPAPATASIVSRLLDATTGQPIVGGVVITSDTGEFVLGLD